MNFKIFSLSVYFILISFLGLCQYSRTIKWNTLHSNKPLFENALLFDDSKSMPYYQELIPLPFEISNPEIELINGLYEPVLEGELLKYSIELNEYIKIETELYAQRKELFLLIRILPLRLNPQTKQMERLVSFDFDIKYDVADQTEFVNSKSLRNSVLAGGSWYKIRLQEEGVYRIDYDKLLEIGIDPSSIDPRNIKIFGNGGGMLPEYNADTEYDGLMENAIFIEGEDDGSFDAEDYILFYGQSPHQWKHNASNNSFSHEFNVYSDYTYYFISIGDDEGKRIQQQSSSSLTPTQHISTFLDFDFYELDSRNLINSGRTWYGELFDTDLDQDFNFEFPNVSLTNDASLKLSVAARSAFTSSFSVDANSSDIGSLNINGINFNTSYPPYAREASRTFNFTPDQDNISINLSYNKPNSSSMAWLNYIEIQLWRNLIFEGGQMKFRNNDYIGLNGVLSYEVENNGSVKYIWDISDQLNVTNQLYSSNNGSLVFVQPNTDLREYIIFDNESYLIPEVVGHISNQNYHALPISDLIIVSPPEFRAEAQRIADLHANQDGMSYCIVEPQKIYNEFSSGAQDISAIRNFVKYQYDNAESGEEPKYLLLFGDASFDYKDKIEGNTNIVPTWESPNAVDIGNSYMSDDYFGLLDQYEGANLLGALDIGIGRLPVVSVEEAEAVVNKIISYSSNLPNVFGSWRNEISLIGDDEDYNAYVSDSEQIAEQIEELCPAVNIDKIYFDAYPQESTPGGERYPDVNVAINQSINKGTLVMNYIGHGGETGWAHERVLELEDINAWDNFNRLAVFITATCEFTRLDDPERKSAGEYVMTNPNGGGIALFTTTRATSAGGNFQLNKNVINYMFKPSEDHDNRFGDVVCASKNAIGNTTNSKKFVLVGDPALKIASPKDSLAVLKINDDDIQIEPDTIKALSRVTIEGSIYDQNHNKITSYEGILQPVVYDKAAKHVTLGQDNGSFEREFELMSNILYKGKASIVNGDFSFSFVVPKDIAYNYDFGKISLYASNLTSDAWGCYDNFLVGGYDDQANEDNLGPNIQLFMNDENFMSGDQIDRNSTLFANISDMSGINTVGNGIGHDIVAVLDDITSHPYVLNEYYEADLDSYTSGSIEYDFYDLENGSHTLDLKAWDVYNNSSTESIEFVIADAQNLSINNLINYPNPFSSETTFEFNLNQNQSDLNLEIQIFNLNGKKVKTITKTDFNLNTVDWSGESDSGFKLDTGIYVYRLIIQTPDGKKIQETNKLLILR